MLLFADGSLEAIAPSACASLPRVPQGACLAGFALCLIAGVSSPSAEVPHSSLRSVGRCGVERHRASDGADLGSVVVVVCVCALLRSLRECPSCSPGDRQALRISPTPRRVQIRGNAASHPQATLASRLGSRRDARESFGRLARRTATLRRFALFFARIHCQSAGLAERRHRITILAIHARLRESRRQALVRGAMGRVSSAPPLHMSGIVRVCACPDQRSMSRNRVGRSGVPWCAKEAATRSQWCGGLRCNVDRSPHALYARRMHTS